MQTARLQPTLASDVFDLDQGLAIKAKAFATPDDRAALWLRVMG